MASILSDHEVTNHTNSEDYGKDRITDILDEDVGVQVDRVRDFTICPQIRRSLVPTRMRRSQCAMWRSALSALLALGEKT